jgi:hypothetical protein
VFAGISVFYPAEFNQKVVGFTECLVVILAAIEKAMTSTVVADQFTLPA